MKKYLLSFSLLCSTFVFAQTSTYQGNGKTGFGGPIGTGSLTVTDNGTSLTFTLTKGTNPLNDILVFYADFTAGGIASTAGLNGVADDYQRAVSGKRGNGVDSSLLTFPADFRPDAAIAFNSNGGKTYFFPPPGFGASMIEGNPPTVTPTGNNNAPTYSQTINKSDLSQGNGPITFKFLGTYISNTAYRSDEAFGDPFTGFRIMQPAQGWLPYAVQSYFTFSTSTLPVKITDFKAVKARENVQLNWSVADETNIDEYLVQRSTDGSRFTTIAKVSGRNLSAASSYSFVDNSAGTGLNYYRLSVVERGRSEFSKVVSIRNAIDKNSFLVVTQGKNLNIKMSGIEAGAYRLSVMNTSGQLVQSVTLQHDGSDMSKQIEINGGIAKGVYRVTLQGENAQFIKSIIVQ